MAQHVVLLLLILAWVLPPVATLFFVSRSERHDGGLRGDRDSLAMFTRRRALFALATYWLLCLVLSAAILVAG